MGIHWDRRDLLPQPDDIEEELKHGVVREPKNLVFAWEEDGDINRERRNIRNKPSYKKDSFLIKASLFLSICTLIFMWTSAVLQKQFEIIMEDSPEVVRKLRINDLQRSYKMQCSMLMSIDNPVDPELIDFYCNPKSGEELLPITDIVSQKL